MLAGSKPARREAVPLFVCFSVGRETKRSRELGLAGPRAGAGRKGRKASAARGLRGRERSLPRPGPRGPPPPVTFRVSARDAAATEGERARRPCRGRRPPHLDLPTPLSPMMRIFRVVRTSSSILTLVRPERSRHGLTLTPSRRRAARACALLLRRRHLLFTEGGLLKPYFRLKVVLRLRKPRILGVFPLRSERKLGGGEGGAGCETSQSGSSSFLALTLPRFRGALRRVLSWGNRMLYLKFQHLLLTFAIGKALWLKADYFKFRSQIHRITSLYYLVF